MTNTSDQSEPSKRLKLAITGTGGRLGGALARILGRSHQIISFNRGNLDLAKPVNVKRVLSETEFDALLNPAAMTSVDECEGVAALAEKVNTEAPAAMAEICRERGARFIHVSTDYVFDGEEPGARSEKDPTNPLGVYGATKLAGEQAVLKADPEALVVRTSWVFGPERPAFPDGIVRRAMQEERVEAIADKWSAPTFADDFAELIAPLLTNGSASGLLHLCNSGSCNWQEYGQAALDIASAAGLELKTRKVEPLLLADMKQFVVPRPIHTAMDTSRYESFGHGSPRHWRDALEAHLVERVQAGWFGE